MQEHEGKKSCRFRRLPRCLLRHQHPQQPPETDGFGAEIRPYERSASGRRIALVEHQIDHSQHCVQPLRHILGVGHRIRNARIANLPLRAHESLRHRRWGYQKRAGDLVGLEAAQRAERQRDLRVEGERRVAAREDQFKAIVGNLAGLILGLLDRILLAGQGVRGKFFLEPCFPPDPINSLVASRLDDPGAGKFRDTGDHPLIRSRRKGFLRRLFGHIEVAEESNQGGDDAAPIGTIDGVNSCLGVQEHGLS